MNAFLLLLYNYVIIAFIWTTGNELYYHVVVSHKQI